MNDPQRMAVKLEQLAGLVREAETEFEKAAIFAATQAIATAFNEAEDQFDAYALEQVEKARWSICAAIGYDVTNNHDASSHVSWALGAASNLRSVLSRAS